MNIRSLSAPGLVLLICSLDSVQCLAAEDPARFLSASAWQGTLTRSASDAGSGQYTNGSGSVCDQRWTLNHSSALNVTIPLDGTSQSGPSRIYLTDADATPFSTLDESLSEDCVSTDGIRQSASYGARLSSDFPTPGEVSMLVDTDAGTYTIDFDLLIGYQMIYNGTPSPLPDVAFWFWNNAGADGGRVTRPLPASGMTISGAATNSLTDAALHGCVSGATASAWNDMQGNLVITWNLTPKTNAVELQVEIKDADDGTDYDYWLPAGNLRRPEEPGNSLKFIGRLVQPDGTPSTDTATSMKCELLNVSQETGVCMNFPINGGANRDFKLLQQATATFWLVDSETSMRTVFPGLTSAEGIVSCYDYGAWAEIKISAMVNGQEIVGYRKGDLGKEKEPIRLPKRKSDSHVADLWKDQHQVRDLADDDDSDNTPVGDKHKGDGFSLYEEYRGFAENQKHIRTSPEVKDLFVRDQIGGAGVKEQILKFGRASALDVHHKLRPGEMAADARMNFNHGYAYLHDQHGLYVRGRLEQKGRSEAVTKAGYDTNLVSTPGTTSRIELEPVEIGLDLRNVNNVRIFRELAVDSLAHELGHGCSVYHHGDSDEPVLLLRQFNPDGSSFLIATDGNKARVQSEDGVSAVGLSYTKVGTNQVLVLNTGERQGQHSGNMDCIMRYHVADTFPSQFDPQHLFYRFNPEDQHSRTLFCESAVGTKANASSPGKPWPRFGDAAEKRGDCKHQLCVNDYYFDDDLHKR